MYATGHMENMAGPEISACLLVGESGVDAVKHALEGLDELIGRDVDCTADDEAIATALALSSAFTAANYFIVPAAALGQIWSTHVKKPLKP